MLNVLDTYSHIRGFSDQYSHEVDQIAAAAERAAERIERETAKLTRPDGSPKFTPQEHQEQFATIHAAAGAEFDRAVSRYVSKAEQDAEDAKKQLAQLEGADGWEKLTESQRQTAATRREFIKEDAATLPASELAKRARAAIAAGDKAACWLWHRYIGQRAAPTGVDGMPRIRAGGADLELVTVLRELGALFGDEDRAQKRRELEEKLRATAALPIAINAHRSAFDGSHERMVAGMRERYRL